ncbi:hypothetical protein [Erwinia persicina]|uniref:hypothetical protein n=1 Tax=Erwinia persicina TaxID=55211 RepID=UPI00177B5CBE|nr:hypothetical protein [Erwinia persicina]MBD8164995.1 hypothetical protein [Erwinia persicina]MBD8216271.1 hypothetical protein [Erwinia persicina]
MTIRELNREEVATVSGARLSGESFFQSLKGVEQMAKLYAAVTPEYAGKDWRYIAAVEPGLNAGMSQLIDMFGCNGKQSLANWARDYA